jgi:hypothetical protein
MDVHDLATVRELRFVFLHGRLVPKPTRLDRQTRRQVISSTLAALYKHFELGLVAAIQRERSSFAGGARWTVFSTPG